MQAVKMPLAVLKKACEIIRTTRAATEVLRLLQCSALEKPCPSCL
jgi:hypothetical protein